MNWPRFMKLKKMQTFLDLINYYWWYITQHFHVVKFLTYFTHKNEEFHWDAEQKKIFVNLKIMLAEMTQLWIFWSEYNKKIKADALDFVIDSNLYQIKNN